VGYGYRHTVVSAVSEITDTTVVSVTYDWEMVTDTTVVSAVSGIMDTTVVSVTPNKFLSKAKNV